MLSQEEIGVLELSLLLSTPAYKIMDEMPYDEFQAWFEYMSLRPPGWKEDRRTFLLLASKNPNLKAGDLFTSLQHIEDNENATRIGTKGLIGSKMFSMMMASRGGVRLGELND
jgi:hypothetical protein